MESERGVVYSDSTRTGLEFNWNFGNGATGNGMTASSTYTTGGTFSAVLTVVDSDGLAATATVRNAPTAIRYAVALTAAIPAACDVANLVTSNAQPVPAGYVLTTSLYGLCYITALVAAGAWIFSRRDFK